MLNIFDGIPGDKKLTFQSRIQQRWIVTGDKGRALLTTLDTGLIKTGSILIPIDMNKPMFPIKRLLANLNKVTRDYESSFEDGQIFITFEFN